MKKHISLISAAVLLGSLMLLSGCNKSPFSHKGELITFGTVSGGVMTRTEYGDDFTKDSKNYQSIVWNTGDLIRVISPEAAVTNNGSNLHYADYKISTVTDNAGASEGKVENVNANGLTWTDESTYSFYAVYPSSTPISLEEATYGQVTADFIKAEQTLPSGDPTTKTIGEGESAITYTVYAPEIKSAVMTASASGIKENDEKPQVKLHFKPAFTAIEFYLSCKDAEPAEVTQIQLVADESEYLVAPFTMTAGAELSTITVNTTDATKVSNKVTLNTTTGTDGITLTETAGTSLTMLLLPKPNTKTLKFRVTSKEGDETKTSVVSLTKSGQPFVLEAGKKYRIMGFKVPGNYWRIFYAPDILDVDAWEELGETSMIVE